jgi:hypothetical protein
VLGHYDSSVDDSHYKLINEKNPTFGVSMTYRAGDRCPNGVLRTSTIDVICDNTKLVIESALEPSKCGYHMVMRSYWGCPVSCPVTSKGLCNSHGHCAYDEKRHQGYCYCNQVEL